MTLGIYYENIYIDREVVIQGVVDENGKPSTIIDGQYAGTVIHIFEGDDLVVGTGEPFLDIMINQAASLGSGIYSDSLIEQLRTTTAAQQFTKSHLVRYTN